MGISNIRGTEGELFALKYLEQQGLFLICKNFHSRFGEIDLIMRDNDYTVFIEVKIRKKSIADGIESITIAKQRKLVKTATYYLLKLGQDVPCRFDAFIIDGNANVQWLKNIIVL